MDEARVRVFGMVALALCLWGCGAVRPPSGPGFSGRPTRHTVRRGETFAGIAATYGLPYRELARVNHIEDPSRIEVGQRLRIPSVEEVRVSVVPGKPFGRTLEPETADPGAPRFHWPVFTPAVSSEFGPRGAAFHDGIDIPAPLGSTVRAAADGEVVYDGFLNGYGRVVILQHRAGYATLYAHHEENHVREGERVAAGDAIGTVGTSGRTTAPNLHFEVRRYNIAKDPRRFLPRIPRARNSGEEAEPRFGSVPRSAVGGQAGH